MFGRKKKHVFDILASDSFGSGVRGEEVPENGVYVYYFQDPVNIDPKALPSSLYPLLSRISAELNSYHKPFYLGYVDGKVRATRESPTEAVEYKQLIEAVGKKVDELHLFVLPSFGKDPYGRNAEYALVIAVTGKLDPEKVGEEFRKYLYKFNSKAPHAKGEKYHEYTPERIYEIAKGIASAFKAKGIGGYA